KTIILLISCFLNSVKCSRILGLSSPAPFFVSSVDLFVSSSPESDSIVDETTFSSIGFLSNGLKIFLFLYCYGSIVAPTFYCRLDFFRYLVHPSSSSLLLHIF